MYAKNKRLGVIYAFLNVFVGGFFIVLGEPLFQVIGPTTFAFLENASALLILLGLYGFFPEFHKLRCLSVRQVIGMLSFALCSSVIAPYLFYAGWQLSSPNNTVLLGQAEMLFTVLLAIFLLKEKVTLQQVSGIVLMAVGLLVITSEGFTHLFSFEQGDVLILLSGLVWAFGSVIFKKYGGKIPMELVLVVRFFLGTILFALVLFILESEHALFIGRFTMSHFWHLLGYAVFAVILRKYFYLKAIQKTTLSLYSAIALTGPVFGLLITALFLGDTPRPFHYLGTLLIVCGFAVIQLHFHRIRKTHYLHKTPPIGLAEQVIRGSAA